MDFLEKVKELAQSAAQTTGEKIEVAKVSIEIKTEESKAKAALVKIGEAIYEKYQNGIVQDEKVLELCAEVDKILEKIQELREKTLELQDKKLCKKCGKELDINAKFCDKCGEPQPDNVKSDDVKADDVKSDDVKADDVKPEDSEDLDKDIKSEDNED